MKNTGYLDWLMTIGTFLLSLFVLYQVLLIIFGGSWSSETVMQAIITVHFALSLTMYKTLSSHTHEIKYLRRDLDSLSKDFKDIKKEFYDFKLDIHHQLTEINRKLDAT